MVLSLFKRKSVDQDPKGAVYYTVKIKDIIRETEDAISIVLENPNNQITYKPGQYITLVMNLEGREVRRSYSFSSSPDQDDYLIVTVKKVEGGKVSAYIVDHLQKGDEVKIMTPSGRFTTDFDPANKRTLVFFAGGSGITPLASLIKSALIREPESKIFLMYQNRNEGSIIFKKMLDELAGKYPDRLLVTYILSRPSPAWDGKTGRLNVDDIRHFFELNKIPLNKSAVFICGPKGMMETVEATLHDLGMDRKRIFKESFYAADTSKNQLEKSMGIPEVGTESKVTIILDNEEHKLTIPTNEFILEAALDADLNMPFSCQSGICTSCRGKLISGEVRMEEPEGLSEDEIESGYILTCVSHPLSREIKIEIG